MLYIKNTTGRDIYDHKSAFTFIENELLTEEEFSVFCPSLNKSAFTKVNVKQSKTFTFFGVRLEKDNSGS